MNEVTLLLHLFHHVYPWPTQLPIKKEKRDVYSGIFKITRLILKYENYAKEK